MFGVSCDQNQEQNPIIKGLMVSLQRHMVNDGVNPPVMITKISKSELPQQDELEGEDNNMDYSDDNFDISDDMLDDGIDDSDFDLGDDEETDTSDEDDELNDLIAHHNSDFKGITDPIDLHPVDGESSSISNDYL